MIINNPFSKAGTLDVDSKTMDILRLIRSENVGTRTFFSLIKLFGSAGAALENIGEFSRRGGAKKPIKVFSKEEAEKELELVYNNKAAIITYLDPLYSKLLLQTPDFPPVLTYKGNINLLNHQKCFAVVGARNASANGRFLTGKIVTEMLKYGYITAAGLARGIDTAAHQVDTAKTVAVIANGIDQVYPPENAALSQKIIDSGGLIISELPIRTKPLGQYFPQRNRLISGISLGTLIVEATLKSGSLITARIALEQDREVFAVPGFPLDPRCQGTNKLLKEGAHLVESAEDILNNLPSYNNLKQKLEQNDNNIQEPTDVNYTSEITDQMRQKVTELLSATPTNFDELLKEVELPLQVVYTIILELELAGKIARYPGNKIALMYNE